MSSALDRLARGCAAVGALALVAGCATVKPPSTVPPTGWPATPAAVTPGSPSPSATPTPKAQTAREGVTVPIPSGYTDATDLVGGDPTGGTTRLVAFLRGPDQHQISVDLVTTDHKTLPAFVAWYVKARNAGPDASVDAQRQTTMAGLPATEITLKDKTDATLTTVFVAMEEPGTLITVTGRRTSDERYADVRAVAEGLRLT